MVTTDVLRAAFGAGFSYPDYVATGSPQHQKSWGAVHERTRLTGEQRTVIEGFSRRVSILAISGLWCGDCAQQMPMLDHIARVNPSMTSLRFVDRDQHLSLAEQVRICGGLRVPTVLFMNEDFEFLSLHGDKSISRLRAIARKSLGASCPVPGPASPDEAAATLQDWVDEFERAHLTARLSPKLRERYGD